MTEFERLVDIVAHLRAEDGCPWDRQQTHTSLKPEVIEEAAEVVCGINIYMMKQAILTILGRNWEIFYFR